MKKKLFSIIMCVLMVMCFMPTAAFAVDGDTAASSDWISSLGDTAPTGYIEKDNSVTIYTAEGLAWFAKQVNSGTSYEGKYVSLTSDIDLSGKTWVPIGNGSRKVDTDNFFSGTFDGGNHNISNLNVSLTGDGSDNHGAGLFGVVKNATIKNVKIASGAINNEKDAAAGVVGVLIGATGTIDNCSNAAGISGDTIGGILGRGYATTNTITNCTNMGTITGVKGGSESAKAGGIVGYEKNTTNIVKCSNSGVVDGNGSSLTNAGGIIGYGTSTFIAECTNSGQIGSSVSRYVGGIAGYTGENGQIIHCSNSGTVTASTNAGGIVGLDVAAFQVKNCSNSGSVTSEGISGGISGEIRGGIIENSSNTGEVIVKNCDNGAAGGVVGMIGTFARVKNCSGGTADMTGKNEGRLVGAVVNGPNYPNMAHIWINDTNGDDYSGTTRTIGTISGDTAWGCVVIESGTMKGCPTCSTENRILVRKNADWNSISATRVEDATDGISPNTAGKAALCKVERGAEAYDAKVLYAYDTDSTVTEVTCTTDGSISCDYNEPHGTNTGKTITIKALGHTYGAGSTTTATCKTDGKITYACTSTGCSAKHEVKLAANGTHTWGTAEVIKDATYSESGLSYSKCTECGATKTDVIARLTRSSSSSSSSTTKTDNVTNTTETTKTETGTTEAKAETKATVSAETKTAADGTKTTTATVDTTTATKIVEKAVENKSEEVVVTAAATPVAETAAGTTTEVAIPAETVSQIAEKTTAAVTIESEAAKVTLDQEAVAAVAETAGEAGTVSLVVETKAQDENKVEVELKLETSNGAVSDFKGGTVSVTVKLNSALAAKPVMCVYIDDNGVYHKVAGQKNADGTYTFQTGHFSTYAILPEEEADAVIANQAATAKDYVKALSLKASSTKTKKGNIKVTLKVDSDEIKAIEDLGYTVKYKFYRSTKKSSSYKAKFETSGKTYTNTTGKKGTRYYYKARVMVYDAQGTLIAKSALKQCKFATRTK